MDHKIGQKSRPILRGLLDSQVGVEIIYTFTEIMVDRSLFFSSAFQTNLQLAGHWMQDPTDSSTITSSCQSLLFWRFTMPITHVRSPITKRTHPAETARWQFPGWQRLQSPSVLLTLPRLSSSWKSWVAKNNVGVGVGSKITIRLIRPYGSKHCLRRYLIPKIIPQSYFLRRYGWIHRESSSKCDRFLWLCLKMLG